MPPTGAMCQMSPRKPNKDVSVRKDPIQRPDVQGHPTPVQGHLRETVGLPWGPQVHQEVSLWRLRTGWSCFVIQDFFKMLIVQEKTFSFIIVFRQRTPQSTLCLFYLQQFIKYCYFKLIIIFQFAFIYFNVLLNQCSKWFFCFLLTNAKLFTKKIIC